MATLADDVRDRAFERLYEGHVRDVYRYVLAVLRNPADAEDVTQTTFMNAYRAFKAGERPQKPQNWLITIAHNACRTRAIRASRRPREVPLDDVVEQLLVPERDKPNVRELLRALGRLPFNQRAAITMRELEGRSYDEIAETLGVTVSAVEALLVRARRTMRLQSSALRGLTAIGLPRSLRGVFEAGDVATAGGALVGGGVLAKAVAVVVAGVVAGGVGYKTVEAGVAPPRHSAPHLEPRAHATPATASPGAHREASSSSPPSAAAVQLLRAGRRTARVAPEPAAVAVVESGSASSTAVGGAQPLQSPVPAASSPQGPAGVAIVQQTGNAVVTPLLPPPDARVAPPVQVQLPLPEPPVQAPPLPAVPALPAP